MIYSSIRMKAFPEKRKELSQTIASLVNSIRTQKGCKHCSFCYNLEDENELCLLGEWENEQALTGHLESDVFKVFLGAASLLESPHEMRLYSNMAESRFPGLPGELIILSGEDDPRAKYIDPTRKIR
jgi:quinol monooxygenase YgiN